MKIGLFADGPWAYEVFEEIYTNPKYEIAFICLRYPEPDKYLIKKAKEKGIKIQITKNINFSEFTSFVENEKCDLLVSMSFDQIFKKKILSLPKFGAINCHAGKLPRYRGRNVLNWVLINDEKEFGITVHFIDEGIDTGDIIEQKTFKINDSDNYQTLLQKSYSECPKILNKAIKKIFNGNVKRIPQQKMKAIPLYCSRRKIGDEYINWNLSSREIFNFIRALCPPGPLAQTFLNNTLVKIEKAEEIKNAPKYIDKPGSIICREDFSFLVKTGDSYLRIVKWYSNAKISAGKRFTNDNYNCRDRGQS